MTAAIVKICHTCTDVCHSVQEHSTKLPQVVQLGCVQVQDSSAGVIVEISSVVIIILIAAISPTPVRNCVCQQESDWGEVTGAAQQAHNVASKQEHSEVLRSQSSQVNRN